MSEKDPSILASLTRNQSLVLERLSAANTPLSAYAILDQLRDQGIKAPLQIYRALEKLLEKGLAHRLESLNAFVACADSHCHNHGHLAFAICENCNNVTEFSDTTIQQRLDVWTEGEGFKPNGTIIEIRGICASCRAA